VENKRLSLSQLWLVLDMASPKYNIKKQDWDRFVEEGDLVESGVDITSLPSLRGMTYTLSPEDEESFAVLHKGVCGDLTKAQSVRRAAAEAIAETYGHDQEAHRPFRKFDQAEQMLFLQTTRKMSIGSSAGTKGEISSIEVGTCHGDNIAQMA
jgi:hypothetical protein